MEMSIGMYTVARLSSNDKVEHGFPFLAMCDDKAMEMVYKAVKDEIDVKVAASAFGLFKIGSYDPHKGQPFIPLREPVCVCTCDQLFEKYVDGSGDDGGDVCMCDDPDEVEW